MRAALVAGLLALSCSATVAAQPRLEGALSLRAAGGYDDNVLFAPFASSGPPPASSLDQRGDGLVEIALRGAVLARPALGLAASLRYEPVLRRYVESGYDSTDHLATLEVVGGPEQWPAWMVATLTGESYAFSAFPQDAFLRGSAAVGADVRLGRSLRLSARYDGLVRWYPGRAQSDVEHRGSLGARLAGGEWALGLEYLGGRHDTTAPDSSYDLHRVRTWLKLSPWRAVELSARVDLTARIFDGTNRVDIEASANAGLTVEITKGLRAIASYDLWVGQSNGDGPNFARQVAWGGIEIVLDGRAGTLEDLRHPLRPRVVGGRVRFALVAPGARHASVIGSFNAWDPEANPLHGPDPAGRFEGTVGLASGRHRYAFVVDGRVVPPPDAPGWAEDDFGGRAGVLWMP